MRPHVDIRAVLETFRFASAELGSEEAGMAVAMRAFAMNSKGQVERRPPQLILDCTCERFEVTREELIGPSQKHRVARARRAAMWLLYANGQSYQETATWVGRKTAEEAMRSIRTVEGDEELQREIGAVAAMIAERLPDVKGAPVIWPIAREA
jgi:chromosomal replication initiation ATPase DnaA